MLNWMIREFAPEAVSENFLPYDAQEVERSRTPLADVGSVRRALLRRIASENRSSVPGRVE